MATMTRDGRRGRGLEPKRKLIWIGIAVAALVVVGIIGFFLLGGDAEADAGG